MNITKLINSITLAIEEELDEEATSSTLVLDKIEELAELIIDEYSTTIDLDDDSEELEDYYEDMDEFPSEE